MAYEKKTWKNRQSEFPNRRTMTPVDGQENTYDVTRNEGLVMEDGDAFDQATMNDLENRVESGISEAGVYTYTALLRLDAWSGSAEAGYTQTVAAESIDGGPAVTSALRLYAPLREPTGVKSTDETLAEVLRIVSEGVAETGAGTVTLTVWEKPTADLQVYWQGKEVAAE